MSFRSPIILSSRPSPKPKRRVGTASPLSKKKRASPRSAEKMTRPKRRLGVSTETSNRRGGKKRHQKEGGDEVIQAAECEEFHRDLNRLINWLTATIDQSEQWKAPSNNTLSIRVQLEKYLAFAMELQTRQHLKDSVTLQGQDLAHMYPKLRANLLATLDLIATQYQHLEERLDAQFRQLEEALSALETSTRSDSESFRSFDAELIMDSIEQMSFRLHNSMRRNSPMEVNMRAMNQQVDTFNTTNKLSSTGGSDSSCSSSPDFDVLYEELSDWLSELHMAVTDSQQGQSDQRMEQMFKGYTQELHLREVTRSKLNKKASRLLARRPSTTPDVTAKLQSINQQWASLQARLCPTGPNGASSQSLPVFASSEEVMTVTLEVEEVIVQLKGWLTEMERKLFAAESIKCPGSVEQMEKRLEAHKELHVDIDKNSEGIQVVLNMCDILQKDKHACATEKERESLQLAAFNLERRWQAIQAQAMALQCSLEEKLRTFKGNSSILGKDSQGKASSEEAIIDGENNLIPNLQTSLFPYRPSGAKDDLALYSLGHGINYDDILLVREAFSENDAFSISDASEVSLGDFAFDDVLPLKGEDEEVALSVPSQTPDIMELSDEMIDAYLNMEEDKLRLEEDEIAYGFLPDIAEIRGRSNSELEFWSMSPRDDAVLSNSVELPHVIPSLEDLDQEPVLLREKDNILQLSQSFNLDGSARSPPNYHPITLGKYSTGTVDFMSSVVEDALESLCSDDDEFEEEDVLEADDEDEEDVDVTITEDKCRIQDHAPNEDDGAVGNLVFAMEDLDESIAAPSPTPKQAKHLSRSLPVTHSTLQDYDLPTHDYPASYPSQPATNTWSHPSVTIAKSPLQTRGFFPSHAGCFLPNPFDDIVTSSPVKEERPIKSNASAELRKLRRRLSQASNPLSEEEMKRPKIVSPPPQDNLLEITDLSLSHMYESLDFVTELTNSLMPGAHPSRDSDDSPLEFPLLENIVDSDSDSFSESSEDIEREDLVQMWINENMPTPPEIIPLQMPPELPFNPVYNLKGSIQEIPTHDLPCLPVCDLEEIKLDEEASGTLFSLASHSGPGIAQEQETDGFLESLSAEGKASQGHCTDAEEVNMADEEVTSGLVQQEVMNQHHDSAALYESSELLPVSDSSVSNGTDSSSKSPVGGTPNFNAIKERLKREIMEQPNKKQAYFTYVSQLAEACADDKELGRVLGEFNHQKCYLWSIGGSLDQPKQQTTDSQDLPDAVSDNWMDIASQCSDDTDKLLEASSSLVEELERGAHLQAKSLPEDEVGSWRDVIVLWLDEQNSAAKGDDVVVTNHDVAAEDYEIHTDVGIDDDRVNKKRLKEDFTAHQDSHNGTNLSSEKDLEPNTKNDKSFEATDDGIVADSNMQDACEEAVDCIDYIGKQWVPPIELIDSGNFSADGTLEDESLLNDAQDPRHTLIHLTSTPKASSANEPVIPSLSTSPVRIPDTKDAATGGSHPTTRPFCISPHPKESSYIGRVLCCGIPICILLFLSVLFVLFLPAVIVSATGECSLSLTDNILLHSPSWEPLLNYVRGPPPH